MLSQTYHQVFSSKKLYSLWGVTGIGRTFRTVTKKCNLHALSLLSVNKRYSDMSGIHISVSFLFQLFISLPNGVTND